MPAPDTTWQRAQLWATFIVALVLGLFYYWFAVADRYAIFLYGHATQNIPPAQPFDEWTSSRYWMAGLVAAGIVMVLYVAECVLVGRVAVARGHLDHHAPSWWRIWTQCFLPIAIGVPAITLTVNTPTLPPALAAKCTVATLAGLALALLPGEWAVRRPLDLVWLVAEALGLVPALIFIRAIELPARGLSITPAIAWTYAVSGCVAGLVWMVAVAWLRQRTGRPAPGGWALFLAGITLGYVLLPLLHHISTPPAYRYITTASNFFASNPAVQALAVVVAGVQAGIVARLHRRFESAARGGSDA